MTLVSYNSNPGVIEGVRAWEKVGESWLEVHAAEVVNDGKVLTEDQYNARFNYPGIPPALSNAGSHIIEA